MTEPNSHGKSDIKMADRTAKEIEKAKWRNDQPRKRQQQNGGPNGHGNSDSKMVDRTAKKIEKAKWRTDQPRKKRQQNAGTEEDQYIVLASAGMEQVSLPARLAPSPTTTRPHTHTHTHFAICHQGLSCRSKYLKCCQHCAEVKGVLQQRQNGDNGSKCFEQYSY